MSIGGIKLSQQIYGIKFYKKEQESAQNVLLSIIKSDEMLIHRHTRSEGRQWGITTPKNLLKLCSKNRHLYEVLISDRQRKLYFDIDVNRTEAGLQDPLDECKRVLVENFPKAQLEISGSRTDSKISYHIILSNWIADNLEDTYCLKDFCEKWHHLGFDDKVYTSNRNMKLINQSKPDGRVQEMIAGTDISRHFIMCYFSNNSSNIKESVIFKTFNEKAFNCYLQTNILFINQS